MSSTKVRLEPQPEGRIRVYLAGAIDESSDFGQLFAQLGQSTRVVMDLSGVERVNSMGVNRWINAFTKLSSRAEVEACSYVVALQAGCVANFFGEAAVRSTLAPYYCGGCRDTQMVLVTAEEIRAAGGVPAKTCPLCQGKMTFDEIDTYFSFLCPREQ